MKTHIVTGLITTVSVLFANHAFADATWVTFLPGYPEGTAPAAGRRVLGAKRRVRVEFIPRIGTFL